jgi:hypothetical protein
LSKRTTTICSRVFLLDESMSSEYRMSCMELK